MTNLVYPKTFPVVDNLNAESKDKFFYIVLASSEVGKDNIPELAFDIRCCPKGEKPAIENGEELVYPPKQAWDTPGIPLGIFKGLEWAKENGKEAEYWKEHEDYFNPDNEKILNSLISKTNEYKETRPEYDWYVTKFKMPNGIKTTFGIARTIKGTKYEVSSAYEEVVYSSTQ